LPARITISLLAGLLGLIAPVAGIALLGGLSQVVNSTDDVSNQRGLTVIGSLPIIPARAIGQSGSLTKRQRGWNIRLIESVDGIAARLLHKAKIENARVVMVSSAVGGEGKTTLATQLGMSLARSGRRTVIVDCDLRKPALHGVFGLPAGPGVSEVLRGECDATEVAHATVIEGLSVVAAGGWDRRSLTALANGAAGVLFEKLREEFEFVIVDTSPILPVADTRFISQHVDIAVLSVFRDVSQTPKVTAACEILNAFGVETVDAVVVGTSEGLRKTDLEYQSQAMA
jgi:succinoglycan biosynthesis transport protein ExoP